MELYNALFNYFLLSTSQISLQLSNTDGYLCFLILGIGIVLKLNWYPHVYTASGRQLHPPESHSISDMLNSLLICRNWSKSKNLRLMPEIMQRFSRKKYYQSKFFYGLMLRSSCKIKSAAWWDLNGMSRVCGRLFGAQVVGSVSGCWIGAKQCSTWCSLW